MSRIKFNLSSALAALSGGLILGVVWGDFYRSYQLDVPPRYVVVGIALLICVYVAIKGAALPRTRE